MPRYTLAVARAKRQLIKAQLDDEWRSCTQIAKTVKMPLYQVTATLWLLADAGLAKVRLVRGKAHFKKCVLGNLVEYTEEKLRA